jgi:hypothetical protein
MHTHMHVYIYIYIYIYIKYIHTYAHINIYNYKPYIFHDTLRPCGRITGIAQKKQISLTQNPLFGRWASP